MRLFGIQLRKELQELWETRRALAVLAAMLAFGFLSPITAKILPDIIASLGQDQSIQIILPTPTAKDALDQFVKNTAQMLMFVAVLVSFTIVVSERERGLMTLMFPHGLPRATFVTAKFAALALLIGAGIVLEAAAAYLYTAMLFSAPDLLNFLSMTLLLYLYLMVMVALALFASTLGHTTLTAGAITVGLVMLVPIVGIFTPLTPNTLTTWAASLTAGIPVPTHFDALIVSLIVIAVSVIASCVILSRQEIVSATGS